MESRKRKAQEKKKNQAEEKQTTGKKEGKSKSPCEKDTPKNISTRGLNVTGPDDGVRK